MVADLLPFILNGVVVGSVLALSGVSLTVVYAVLGFANFSHSAFLTLGAYTALFFTLLTGNFVIGIVAAVILVGGIAAVLDLIVWRPARRQWADTLALILISVGIGLIIRNVVLFLWGARAKTYPLTVQQNLPFASITVPELLTIVTAILLMAGTHWLLQATRLGTAMRAVAENKELSEITGIPVNRVILFTWFFTTALNVVAGVLYGAVTFLRPEMGFNLLIPVFAVIILGGVGNPYGAMVAGFLVGIAQELSVAFIPAEYKIGVSFLIITAFLLFRSTADTTGFGGGS